LTWFAVVLQFGNVRITTTAAPMKSVRLNPELQERLERAALAANVTQSEFIREAVSRRCDEVLSNNLAERLARVIGMVKSSGGRAARTGEAYRDVLSRRRGTR
jgi:predicted DNA-binding protein